LSKETKGLIEEEYRILRDLSDHPNLPNFYGVYLKKGQKGEKDQVWFVQEVTYY
jgi:myosin-3